MVNTRNSMGKSDNQNQESDAIERKIETVLQKVSNIDNKLESDERNCKSIRDGYERLINEWVKKCEVGRVDHEELQRKYGKACEEVIDLKGKLSEQKGLYDTLKVEMQQAVIKLEFTIQSMTADKEKETEEHTMEIKILNEQLIKEKEDRKMDNECKSGVPKAEYNALLDDYELVKGKYSKLKGECDALKTKIDQINYAKKQVEKGKLEVIREKTATTTYFVQKVKDLEDKVQSLQNENLSLKSSSNEKNRYRRYSPDNRRRNSSTKKP